ncbi:hypothetical protein EG830_06540 [bacterium]|nr:hypothetical protein [bacterium]
MKTEQKGNGLFFRLIGQWTRTGFRGLYPEDPLVTEIEKTTDFNNQFVMVTDKMRMKSLYVSNRSLQMIGVKQGDFSPYHLMEATHPDDAESYRLFLKKSFDIAGELLRDEDGARVLSVNVRLRNPQGLYSNSLIQVFLYYSSLPDKSVFSIEVITDLGVSKINSTYHSSLENKLSLFHALGRKMSGSAGHISGSDVEHAEETIKVGMQ